MFDSGFSVQTRRERHHVPADSTNLVITRWLWHHFHWVAVSEQSIEAERLWAQFIIIIIIIDKCKVQEKSEEAEGRTRIHFTILFSN